MKYRGIRVKTSIISPPRIAIRPPLFQQTVPAPPEFLEQITAAVPLGKKRLGAKARRFGVRSLFSPRLTPALRPGSNTGRLRRVQTRSDATSSPLPRLGVLPASLGFGQVWADYSEVFIRDQPEQLSSSVRASPGTVTSAARRTPGRDDVCRAAAPE